MALPRQAGRAMSVLERRWLSQAPLPNVNLYCSHCNVQIGIFDNEWVRLTASYARSRETGTHFGVETGKKVKTVPQGQAHNAAEGCGMSEVFCIKCSSLIGQYCRTAPDKDKQYLVGQYFYKMSRTFLRDSQSTQHVEPIYSYGGDLSLPPPKPKLHADSRMSMGNTPRQSQTPLPLARQPRDSLGQYNMNGAGSSFDGINDSIGMPNGDRGVSETPPSSSDATSLKTLVEQQGSLLAEMRSEMREFRMQRQETPRFQSMTPAIMPSTLRLTQEPHNDEVSTLRAENENLKARLASIASAMGLDPADLVGDSSSERGERTQPPSALGKRKRLEDEQLPTPHSTQGSNSDRDQYFARPQLPPSQPFPYQQHPGNYGFNSGPYYPPAQPHGYPPYQGHNHMNGYGQWPAPPYWGTGPGQHAALPAPGQQVIAGQLATYLNQQPQASGVVEFSDDEMPKPLTIQQLKRPERNRPGSSGSDEASSRDDSMEPTAPIVLELGQHWTAKDVEKMIEEEQIPKLPRELMDPKDKIQSTEKYLNTELEELGLAEFIGKDKKNPEYKKAVTAARAAAKEKKKADALAAKGLRSIQTPEPPRPANSPTEEILSDSPDGVLGELEATEEPDSDRASVAELVEAPVEPQALALKATGRKRRAKRPTGWESAQRNSDVSADEILSKVTIEPVVNAPARLTPIARGLDDPVPASAKSSTPARSVSRKAVAVRSTHSRASAAPAAEKRPLARARTPAARKRRATKAPAPLEEVTNLHSDKPSVKRGRGRPAAAKVTTPLRAQEEENTATKVVTPPEDYQEQSAAGQENEADSRVMTRRRLKEAEIQKRDRIAQEMMEIEQV